MQLLMDVSVRMVKPIIVSFLVAEAILFCAIALRQNNRDQSLILIPSFSA